MPDTKAQSMTDSSLNKLADFSFLIGNFECEVRIEVEENDYIINIAYWKGKYILDGSAIEDEYKELDKNGDTVRHGINIRSYNDEHGWIMKWFDTINSTWLDLGPKELGGVSITDSAITFKHYAENNVIIRITFYEITEDGFSWKADLSNDNGNTWDVNKMTIKATRIVTD
ncbi:MAG: hypothetical protein ROO71_03090 [Balneola sp.]